MCAEDHPGSFTRLVVVGLGEVGAGDGGVECAGGPDDSFIDCLGAWRGNKVSGYQVWNDVG